MGTDTGIAKYEYEKKWCMVDERNRTPFQYIF